MLRSGGFARTPLPIRRSINTACATRAGSAAAPLSRGTRERNDSPTALARILRTKPPHCRQRTPQSRGLSPRSNASLVGVGSLPLCSITRYWCWAADRTTRPPRGTSLRPDRRHCRCDAHRYSSMTARRRSSWARAATPAPSYSNSSPSQYCRLTTRTPGRAEWCLVR